MPQLLIEDLLGKVTDIVLHAGMLLSAEWSRPDGRRGTGDKAAIDLEIELFLKPELLSLMACDFWGEETAHTLSDHPWCWVVDPNDGTRDFLKGLKGSAISVGLLHNKLPVLGIVYAPVTPSGVSDCIAWAEGLPYVMRNGSPVGVNLSSARLTADGVVMVSAAATQKAEINYELCKPWGFEAMPSIAYRLARVAVGDGVCAVSLYPVSAHDVVAGHALLKGANGVLVNEAGEPITYDTFDEMATVSQRCFGGAPAVCDQMVKRDWRRVFDD